MKKAVSAKVQSLGNYDSFGNIGSVQSKTDFFTFSGYEPRGNGKWAFGNLDEIMFISGTYSKAKKQASAHFKGWFQVLP
jgi:hypothetical protein